MTLPAPLSIVPPEGGTICTRGRPDYRIDHETGCWEWLKMKNHGYPYVARYGRAHREYFRRAYGPIPDGHDLHHICHNRGCVNPDHLEPVLHSPHLTRHTRPNSPVTAKQVVAIRVAAAAGEPVTAIAERYGLIYQTAWNLVCGRNWANVGGPITRPVRPCQWCGETIPTTRKRTAKYCSIEHRLLANRSRGR